MFLVSYSMNTFNEWYKNETFWLFQKKIYFYTFQKPQNEKVLLWFVVEDDHENDEEDRLRSAIEDEKSRYFWRSLMVVRQVKD